jgi:carbonic anhydrase
MRFILLAGCVLICSVVLCQELAEHHEWTYSGLYGPDHWAELEEEYRTCNGILQSPIDIIPVECTPAHIGLAFHYRPFTVDLLFDGHTLIERIVESRALTFNNVNYTLLQFHFHTPSEHHIDGKEFDMEIHFVHQSDKGKYAVLAVLVKKSLIPSKFLSHFMGALPTHINEEIRTSEAVDVMESIPADPKSFFYYDGSLTTPPCTEGVNWIVFKDHVFATEEQIEAIHSIIQNDNRPIQDVNDRLVFYSH